LIKTIFKNFPDIYTHLGTNLYYIPIVISKSAHPNIQPARVIQYSIQAARAIYKQLYKQLEMYSLQAARAIHNQLEILRYSMQAARTIYKQLEICSI
jgi:hypothetical protein